MLKVLFVILLAAVATMFAMDNMQRVELGLIVGRPVHVRLFFLLLVSFLAGSFLVAFLRLWSTTSHRVKQSRMRKALKAATATKETESEDLYFH